MRALASLCLCALVFFGTRTQSHEYAGGESCRSCHLEIYSSYQKVGMARSFDRIERAPILEDWSINNRYYHAASRQYFQMFRRAGKFFQRRYQLDVDGKEIHSLEREIHFVLGSGNKERDYLHLSPAGELTQLPVVWYSREKSWGMAPGYDHPDHQGFSRQIDYRCVFCHNAYPKLPEAWTRYEAARSRFSSDLPSGIDCERCHGPGGRHVAAPTKQNIVQPSKLSRKLQLDICLQCHLETSSALVSDAIVKVGRGIFSYKPGESLLDYAAYFDYPSGSGHDDDFNIVHQGYRLRKSACFKNSEMTCTTCHDPHGVPENKTRFHNAKCATCHESPDCKETADRRAANGDNCVACHMPQRRTDDVIHVVMTDHYIQRKPRANLLSPRAERSGEDYRGSLSFYFPEQGNDLELGLALVRGPDVRRGIELLERTIVRDRLRAVEPFYNLAFGYQSTGQLDRAVENYRRALQIDPPYSEARYNLGASLLAKHEIAKAIEEFNELIRRQPEFTDAYVARAAARLQAQRSITPKILEEARQDNLQALRLNPIHTVALNNLGLLALQQRRFSEAESYFRQVLAIQPDNPTALRNIPRQ